jgi:hypothetical protein
MLHIRFLYMSFILCMSSAFTTFSSESISVHAQENKLKKAPDKKEIRRKHIEKILASWRSEPRAAARKLIAKYGQPAEVTRTSFTWYNNGPWKYTIISNEENPVVHNFPHPHQDFLKQVIDYPVHAKTYKKYKNPQAESKLRDFNGSIIIDKTRGELGVHCDEEATNFLALNLAHEIITGKKTVAQARDTFTKQYIQYRRGLPSDYTTKLMFKFDPKQGDADIISQLYKQLLSVGKEAPKQAIQKNARKDRAKKAKKSEPVDVEFGLQS